MQHPRRLQVLAAAIATAAACASARSPVIQWDIREADPAPAIVQIFRGETVTLQPRILADGAPVAWATNAQIRLYWQTNGMDSAWWSVPAATGTVAGRLSATWSPTNDAGAAAYAFFISASASAGVSYRAHGRILMRGAPGASPALLNPPTALSDALAAAVAGLFDPAGAAQAVSNALAAAVQSEAGTRAAGDSALITSNAAARAAAAVHAARTDNPHAVTAAQVGAWTAAASAASNAAARAAAAALVLGDALRTIQPGAANWFALANGTATLYRVTSTAVPSYDVLRLSQTDNTGGEYNGPAVGTLYPRNGDQWGEGADTLTHFDDQWSLSKLYGWPLTISWTTPAGSSLPVDNYWLAGDGENSFGRLRLIPSATNSVPVTNSFPLATLADLPSVAGLVSASELAAVSNFLANAAYTKTASDARYLSSTPGWFWQGSQAVVTNTWTASTNGMAYYDGAKYRLIPYTTSRHDVTGSVTVTSSRYIVDVVPTLYLSGSDTSLIPKVPVGYSQERVSPTSFIVRAWCSVNPMDANSYYYAYASNIVVQTYDRASMVPGLYTNDGAGIISRVDALPGGTAADVAADPRRAVNAGSLRAYLDSRKTEIADHAWNRTPGGRDTPDSRICTIDEPLVQQGAISYLQSGDYYVFSYAGGDWYNSTTGSTWRIGPGGRVAFEISATNRMLHVSKIVASAGYVTLDISTNWVVGTPSIEFTSDLANPQWLTCPAQTMTSYTTYWRGVCPGVATSRFFRVVSPGGENVIRSHYRHEFLAGVTLFGQTYTSLAALKAALEALP